jgi:hypothetical protein
MIEELQEIWRVHEEINRFLLERMPEEGLAAVTLLKNGKPSTGRTVSRVFAHLHQVRISHLGRELLAGVPRFEPGVSPSRQQLLEAFQASSRRVEQRLVRIAKGANGSRSGRDWCCSAIWWRTNLSIAAKLYWR